jgi:methionine-rich copper-binding protein CopC
MASLHSLLWRKAARVTGGKHKGASGRKRLAIEQLENREVPSTNPIVAENQLPGNPESEWQVAGDGDSTLQGFSTDISANVGQTISFKVNDTASAAYHIDIYRLGYYQGNGARKVATIPSSQTTRTVQPHYLFDSTTNLIDAGNWSVSASWAVPSTATSGLYIARLVREDTGGASLIYFVVRNDASHSDLLFQTSDSTWEAYNYWGGESVYGNSSGAFDERADKVSYNRPLTLQGTAGGLGSYNSPLHAEYPMIRFLEKNGYDISYFTDVDSSRNGSLILNHKVFMSVGHDEYWSGQQRTNVEAARSAGINLAFFSGNEIFWKTRWENSTDGSNTAYRTMVCYKESKDNARTDPLDLSQGIWTGTWRDARFSPPADGGRPENNLSGTMYMNDRTSTDTGISMQVPAQYANLRFWRNTAVAKLQTGQVATIGDRVVGYETDEDVNNGFRPAGLFDLSATTFTSTSHVLDAAGVVVGNGTSTQQMTLYRAPSGALVFGAGTVQWSWGLDGDHIDGAGTADPTIQQATVNLFADMGVQPSTLQGGLVPASMSTDLTAPTSSISAPSAGVNVTAGVPTTISGTASDSGGGVVAGVEVSTDGGHTWYKATGTTNWTYTWTPTTSGPTTILSRAADDSGNIQSPGGGVAVNVKLAPTSTTGLVAAFDFNAGSGTTVTDASSSHNNGTITNATWVSNGQFGGALSFNGTNSWVTIPSSSSLNLSSGMTLEAWVKPATATGYGSVLFKETSGGDTYSLYSVTGNSQPPAAYINTNTVVYGPSALSLAGWSHLAATYDGTNLSLYVNGNLVNTTTTTIGPIQSSTGALRIGGNSVYGDYFNGLIDEVRVYNRALNQGEIRSDMSTPIGGAIDSTPPTVALNSPTVNGTIDTLSAAASDNVGIGGVQFLLNGQPLGPKLTAAPYTYAWDTSKYVNGTYTISAQAFDVAGNTATSPTTQVSVANATTEDTPAVSLDNLRAGSTVGGTVVLSALASDSVGVAGVQFQANGVNIGSEVTTAPYRTSWNTSSLASGTYSITAIAYNIFGNSTTSVPISVTVDSTPPTITGSTPAANATAVPTNTNPTVTFSESIQPSTLTAVLKDAAGNPLADIVTYDDSTHTATISPAASFTPSSTYTVTVSGAADLVGNVMSGTSSWSFTTDSKITGATVWSGSTVPGNPAVTNDSSPIEVGMKFRASVSGSIVAIEFYKGTGNTGTHIGHLWTSTGTLLATVTFTNESASGWQQAVLSTPVTIQANTTYVVSYYAPNGHYAFDSNYFATSGVNSYPLQALANGVDGGNGVFIYPTSSGGAFPNGTYNAANYWVDVVFSTTVQDTTPPTVTTETPASGAASVSVNNVVTATFSEPVQANTILFSLTDASGTTVPATVAYNDAAETVILTPNAALANSTTYTATLSGTKDAAGNPMASSVTWSFTTAAASTGGSIWTDSTVPAIPDAQSDSGNIEVGMKFRSDTAGYVTGIRFYKGSGNTGTHVGHLWTSTGTLLASVTFTGESASGWQTANFSSPVPIAASTTYVISYQAPNGNYAFTSGFFSSSGVTSGHLTALANGVDGGNGLFVYPGGRFPNGTYQAANYWVDVVFALTAQDTTPPTVASQTPASGATAVPTTSTVTATFSEPVQASTISFVLTDAARNAVPASVTYNSSTLTATLTPTTALQNNTTYTATVSGANDTAGNTMTSTSWSFSTPALVTNASIFPGTATPTIMSASDPNAIEVGVRFFSDVAGYISGLRFYKGPNASGTHVGHLWTSSGILLATATFTNETASGWQTVTFSSPVAIAANTTYVASYYAPFGYYSATSNYFATSAASNGDLTAPASGANGGNGVYTYQSGGGFPTSTYNATNYWVDVLFSQSTTDTTPPTSTAVSPLDQSIGQLPTTTPSVTFSESIDPTSVTVTMTDVYKNVIAGNMAYNDTTKTVTFIPTSPLLSFMAYSVTVSGVKDLSGNSIAAPVTWSFRTRGIWLQTTVGDFSSGTNNGTIVTNNAGGEITLAPALNDDFSENSLAAPSTWSTESWASQGGGVSSVALSNGILTMSGTAILSSQSFVNSAVEAEIAFGASPYQHFGLTTSFDSVAGNYWALFSTGGTTNSLYARVDAKGSTTDVNIGALPTGFHDYKIQPTSAGFDFYVDGVLQTSIAASFQTTVSLKAGISAFNASPAIQADWIRYGTSTAGQTGTFTSTMFDAGVSVSWSTVNWTATVPTGAAILVEVETSSDGINWSNWAAVNNNGAISSVQSRFLRYRITLTANSSGTSPSLSDIAFTWM